jgi:phosphonate transport system substrate-binding protein
MKSRKLLAGCAALGLVVAACGSDDDSGSDSGSESTDTPAATDAPDGSDAPADIPEDWPEELVFTLTPSQETGGLIETAEPLAELLAEELGVDVTPLVPTDYAGVIVALESGQAQVAGGLGPRQMVQAEEQAGAELILQSERFGSLRYVTQWFTNDPDTYCDDEPVADEDGFLFCNGVLDAAGPEDGPIGATSCRCSGQTVSFVDQGSTSGLRRCRHSSCSRPASTRSTASTLFAGGHDSSVQAVYDGDAVVGVSFNDARGELVDQFPDVGEKVVVFGWSAPDPERRLRRRRRSARRRSSRRSPTPSSTSPPARTVRCTPQRAVQHRRPRAGHVERLRRDPRPRDRARRRLELSLAHRLPSHVRGQ